MVNVLKYRNLGSRAALVLILLYAAPRAAFSQAPARPAGPDSVVYFLTPASILEVHAGKTGLLAGFGHEHRVRAHAFSGTVVYFPGDLSRSRVSVTVLTDSLRVIPEADSADIPEITRTMQERTLRVDSFPEIRFVSTSVTTAERGEAGSQTTAALRVSGDLTMVGVTRPVSVDLTVQVAGDTLRAEGGFVVRQTDFGIKPFSKALGMVKVKDEVRFELRVVAARAH
jgi:polyisoprenoid-binding protein YceI